MKLDFLTGSGYERAVKKAAAAAVVWLLALVVFLLGTAMLRENRAKLAEADSVLNAVTLLKAYRLPENAEHAADASLTSLTDIINASGISDRVAQLDSNGGGTLVRADRVYPDELGRCVSMLSAKGMQITAAEIRAANVNGERLLFIKLSVRGADK